MDASILSFCTPLCPILSRSVRDQWPTLPTAGPATSGAHRDYWRHTESSRPPKSCRMTLLPIHSGAYLGRYLPIPDPADSGLRQVPATGSCPRDADGTKEPWKFSAVSTSCIPSYRVSKSTGHVSRLYIPPVVPSAWNRKACSWSGAEGCAAFWSAISRYHHLWRRPSSLSAAVIFTSDQHECFSQGAG